MAGQRSSYGKRSHSQSDSDAGNKNKRRNPAADDSFLINADDTVYRYLCPIRKIGSVIGRGGDIVKQLRADTRAKIRIGDSLPGCDDRVVTIYSSSDETNRFDDTADLVSPAQDALFRVHQRVIAEDTRSDDDNDEENEERNHVTARLLVPSDQIGCVIGKGGQIVQSIRNETGAQIRILKDDRLPPCALISDELVQISGEAAVVKKALFQIASRLHDNPSRSQHLLASAVSGVYAGGVAPAAGAPIVGVAPFVGAYGGYKGDAGDWSRSLYSAPRDEASLKEFSARFVCPTGNIGGVIGKGGAIINQIRQDSGATIKVDSSATEGDDCLIIISTKEFFEDTFSPTIEAAVRLQPRCSEKLERDSGIVSFTTRLLVPTSRIGCLIGKGGTIITEMRRLTKANIRILSKENLPKIASGDDEMVQISGDLDVAKDALVQVLTRLRANLFDKERAVSSFLPVLPYLPASVDGSDGMNYDSRDGKRHGRGGGHSYSGGYGGSSDLASGDGYGSYGSSQLGSSGAYGSYSLGRSSASGSSTQNGVSRRRNHAY
ncbi:RNA-binding KH domain-containing protein RCF3-like [Abrus precatorius]|uniref:RNA-binding KH domain-containing protein RCF3-like n=1 Tax=Abrus precatorius TaxID=3816 RepID=A0A8B8L2K1_ABRPR|nr:RNA-binding KH domain-containing protein RCF3-like [Abrus precatorius]